MLSRLVKKIRALRSIVVFCLGIVSVLALAQQQIPTTVPENTETVSTGKTTVPSSETEPAATLPETKGTPPATRFSPTEKIRAGDAVPLPVNI